MNGALGTLHGYACLWDVPSRDLSADDGSRRFDIIKPRAITFAPDVRANVWHIRDTFFASVGRGTLEIFADARGVGFAAEIPETPSGYNLFNGLRDGRSLGVSAELCDVTAEWRGDERIISRAELSGFAISDISATAFPQLRCWLCGDQWPVDPQARALAERFWVIRRRPVANAGLYFP
jgi:phage head maturation protease